MKISEVIKELQAIKESLGDLPVYVGGEDERRTATFGEAVNIVTYVCPSDRTKPNVIIKNGIW